MFRCEHANTKQQVSEHSWLSGWVILSILTHLTHFAQSYFSLISSAIKICSDQKQKLGEKWWMLTTFFLMATAAITGISSQWALNIIFAFFFFKFSSPSSSCKKTENSNWQGNSKRSTQKSWKKGTWVLKQRSSGSFTIS